MTEHNFDFPESLQEEGDTREYNFKWWAIVIGLGLVFWGSVAAAVLL